MSRTRPSLTPPQTVLVLSPGGRRARGGMGRMVDYFVGAWQVPDLPMTVVDTYGPGPQRAMPWYFLRSLFCLLKAGLRGQVSCAHIHMSERLSVIRKGLLLYGAHACGAPVVLHLHGADFADWYRTRSAAGQRAIRAMVGSAERVVVLGRFWQRFVEDELQVPGERVAVLHNAVPTPELSPEPLDPAPCRLLFLGEVGERKGFGVLLEALATPALRHLEWTLEVAGNGAIENYRQRAERLGLGRRVLFHGWTDQAGTQRLLARSEVLVLPSRNEGLPIAILEAMSWRLAIVATPVGAITDAIDDEVNGLLVPPNDPDALSAALTRLVEQPALRGRLAEAARTRHLSGFAIAPYVRHLEQIIREAIATGKATAPRQRASRLIERLADVPDEAAARRLLQRLLFPERPLVVSFVNQHGFNLAWNQPGFSALLTGADLLLRDGIGMKVAMRLLGRAPGLNMNGTDFIPRLLEHRQGQRLLLAGTASPWLEAAASYAEARGLSIVGKLDGFQPDETYVAAIQLLQPALVILGMGMPKQERIAARLADAADFPVVIVNGGAILDFWAGRFPRAPRLIQRLGLEWAFRLCQEPGRLWRRYGTGGLMFVIRIFRMRMAQPRPAQKGS